MTGNIALSSSGAALIALRTSSTTSDQQLFQRHVALTSGGAVAAASDVSHMLTAPLQGKQPPPTHQQHPLQDTPASPSRSTAAAAADGDSDMTTLIVDIQVRCSACIAPHSRIPANRPFCAPDCCLLTRLQRLWSELGVSPSVELAAMMDCTLLGATQNSHAKDSVHAPQLKENRLFPCTCSAVETNNRFCFCSATLHVLCLIRSKLHDLKRQRKERLGELLQVI